MEHTIKYKYDNIFDLLPSTSRSIPLIGMTLPNNIDVYFRSKQKEIIEQYSGARILLMQTEEMENDYWFSCKTDNPEIITGIRNKFRAHLYESALFKYNLLVDLSWTLCYSVAEFSYIEKGKLIEYVGLKSVDEANSILRKAEQNVTSPTAENNPFAYLYKMCPEFELAFNIITNFWESDAVTSIRKTYNYCKHKGKPNYTEIKEESIGSSIGIFVQQGDKKVRIPSAITDVQLEVSLEDEIEKLVKFDDAVYEYLKSLFDVLEEIIKPSQLV